MVWLRGIEHRRGALATGVAVVFLLGVGVLGYRLASAPASESAAAPPAAPAPAPGSAAPAPVPGSVAPAQPVPGQPVPGQPVPGQPVPGQPVPGQPAPAAPNPVPNAPNPAANDAAPGIGPLDMVPANVAKRLRTDGFAVALRESGAVTDCVANSSGQTQAFLRANPCAGLQRALLTVRGPGRGEALVSLAWVRMPSPDMATALRAVLDRPGTGNINALADASSFTGQFYASRVTGTVAVNADVRPTAPGLSPADLKKIAFDALG